MHRTRNAAYGQPYRGFESLPLRQIILISLISSDFLDFNPRVAARRSGRKSDNLRRTARTMARMGVSSEVGEHCLAHASPEIEETYNRTVAVQERRMLVAPTSLSLLAVVFGRGLLQAFPSIA